MKVMNKRRIKIRQAEDLCWNERRILEALGSPFVVSGAPEHERLNKPPGSMVECS